MGASLPLLLRLQKCLPNFESGIGNHTEVRVLGRLCHMANGSPEIALELGEGFSDPVVRAYAVLHLSRMKDEDLRPICCNCSA